MKLATGICISGGTRTLTTCMSISTLYNFSCSLASKSKVVLGSLTTSCWPCFLMATIYLHIITKKLFSSTFLWMIKPLPRNLFLNFRGRPPVAFLIVCCASIWTTDLRNIGCMVATVCAASGFILATLKINSMRKIKIISKDYTIRVTLKTNRKHRIINLEQSFWMSRLHSQNKKKNVKITKLTITRVLIT